MGIPVPRDLQAEFNAKIRALFDKVADAINKEHPSHQDFDFDGFIEGFDEDSPLTQEVFEYLVKDSALRHWNSNPPAMITSSSSSSLAPSTGTRPAVIHRPARDSFSDWLSFRPPLYSTPPLPPPRPPRRQYTIHHHQNPAPLRAPASALGSGTTLPPHLPAAVTTTDVPLGTTTFTTSSSDFTNEHEVQDSTPDDHTAFTPANSTPRPTRSNSNSSVYRNTFVDHRDDFGPDVELDYPLRRSIFTAPHRRRPAFIPVASSTAPSTTLNSFWDDAATSGDEFLNNNDTNTNNIGVGESDSDDSDEIDSVEMQRTLLEDSSSGDRFRPLRSSTNRSIRDARRVFNERLNRTIFNEADEEEDTAATTTLMQQGQQAGLPSDTTTPQPRRRGFSGSAVVPSPLSRRPTFGQVLPTYGRMSLPSWPQSSSTSSSTSLSPSLSSSALDGRASRTASYSFSQIEAFRRATESLQRDIQSLRSQVAATQASFAAQRSHNSTNNSSGNNNDRGYYSSNSFGSAGDCCQFNINGAHGRAPDHTGKIATTSFDAVIIFELIFRIDQVPSSTTLSSTAFVLFVVCSGLGWAG
ncbi:hypothetical protein BGZ83_006658 [Gryganskiella cystojenkinii]|nr:hypothetical protein BGZ83_006658 [Gryganskiella cystojenkinii]